MKKKTDNLKIAKLERTKLLLTLETERADKTLYQTYLNQIVTILSGTSRDRVPFAELTLIIAKLMAFKEMNEGRYHPMQDTVNSQREIIRWLIKPSTAEEKTQVETKQY